MPLPIAHSLMGYAIAKAAKVRLVRKTWLNVVVYAALANLPDIDFLPGFLMGEPNRYHHFLVHSISFALCIGLIGGMIVWRRGRKSANPNLGHEGDGGLGFWPYFLTISLVVFSHCFLDLLTEDSTPPHGMVLLWPFDMQYYDMDWDLFKAVHKSNTSATFFQSLLAWYNFEVVLWELLIMLPVVGLVKVISRLKSPVGWRRIFGQQRGTNIAKTLVARLGLLKASSLPRRLSGRRSLAAVLAETGEEAQHE
jgi:inner membrane protein